VTAIRRQIDNWRSSGVLGQLIRFGIAGGMSTVIYAAVFVPLSHWVFKGNMAVLAVPPAFVVAATAGFFMHSAWSFKGHGRRDTSGRQHVKFLVVQLFGMALNAIFTWIITGPLFHAAPALSLIPAVAITPLATFALNRQWVFG
jgi:putative flippase GtrA